MVSLPFYKLSTKFGDPDQSKTGCCGVSAGDEPPAGALSGCEQGFNNVKVYRP